MASFYITSGSLSSLACLRSRCRTCFNLSSCIESRHRQRSPKRMHTGSPHSSSSEALRQRPGDCERTESLRDVDHSPRAAQRAGAVERGAGGRMVRWSEADHSLRGAAISHAHQPAAGAPRSHHARLRAAPSTAALEAFDFCTRPRTCLEAPNVPPPPPLRHGASAGCRGWLRLHWDAYHAQGVGAGPARRLRQPHRRAPL